MKLLKTFGIILVPALRLASCGSQAPLTEAEQAEKYNMSVEEFREQKDAAARMNMTIEEHLNMGHGDMDGMDHDMMDMDDSHMIEDDAEMSGTHTMEDGSEMDNSMEMEGKHVMEDGSVMADDEMHMEMMHDGEDIEKHGPDEHGEHE